MKHNYIMRYKNNEMGVNIKVRKIVSWMKKILV